MDEHGEINVLLFSGLTAHNGSNEVVAGLAESWEYDESACTYTFHLRDGVAFMGHNGLEQRADLRAQANDLDTTLMVGKGGVTENVLSEAARQLEARELVKGRVLEATLLSAREVCDALCEALGADGVQCVGSKFVIYRRSEKKAQEAARQARELKKRKSNPVRRGAQERRRQAREERERRNEYFRQAAIQAAIERRKSREE